MYKILIPMFAVLLTLTGCDKDSKSMEEREERDPLVNSGQAYMEQGNYDEAINAFKQALEKEPRMARPHLDLAIIYQQHKVNFIHAIYHYDRYLELRPDAEKASFIEEQKLKVAQALANTLINNSPEVKQVVQERNTLIQQNRELKKQLAEALKASPKQTTAPAASTPTPKPAQTVTKTIPKSAKTAQTSSAQSTAKPTHQIYHVVSGDTLTKISTKFYGDSSSWDVIMEANKDSLKSPNDLKVGQTLVIPALDN